MSVYIALGSNLSNPKEQVHNAVKHIEKIPRTRVIAKSSLYKTPPLGPQNQPEYINQVICIETTLTAYALLQALLAIEIKMGRIRLERWGARIIDCDIILFGNEVINTPALTIPHPEMTKRSFVLFPLAEIAPHLVLPSGDRLQTVLRELECNIK